MGIELTKEQELLKLLFKDFSVQYNGRNVSKKLGLSHSGAFRILKRLENKEIVRSKLVGNARIYSLNSENPVTFKEIDTILTIESLKQKRWVEEFNQLEDKANFVLLFGSILRNDKYARDIDLLIIADKKNHRNIRGIIKERNKISNKPIHAITQTPEEFKLDLNRKYKVTIEIIRTGIVLSKQENFIRAMV